MHERLRTTLTAERSSKTDEPDHLGGRLAAPARGLDGALSPVRPSFFVEQRKLGHAAVSVAQLARGPERLEHQNALLGCPSRVVFLPEVPVRV